MLFKLSEEQKLIKDTARDFAANSLAPLAAQIDREEKIPESIISKISGLGFWGITVPEEYGGAELDTMSLALVLEQISYACAATSVTLSVHNSLTCNTLIKYGSAEQKKKYLPRLAKGEIIGAFSLTEPNAGSDAGAIQTKATLSGNNYILNGVKAFTSSAPLSGLIVIFARTHPDASLKAKGVSAFLVEPGFTGVKIGPKESKMGMRGSPMSEIILENAVIPQANLLGQENHGFGIAMEALDCGRIGIAMQSIGIAQACLDASIKYAKERKQFGKSLNEFQSVKWKIVDVATELEASRLLAYQSAMLRDNGRPYTKEASMAKLFSSIVANKAAKEALQIHGGMGYTKDFPIERYFRDARVTEIYEGTSEVQHLVISKFLNGE